MNRATTENQQTFDDKTIIHGIKNKDKPVISQFVKDFENRIFRLSMQYVASEDEALDIVQEVFITVLEKIDSFREESKLSTWIYSITVFTCIGYLRKKKKKKETSYDQAPPNSDVDAEHLLGKYTTAELNEPNPTEDGLLAKEARQKLMKEIFDLPSDYKTIFILKELEGFSIKQIQETVPISVSAIKTRLHRARVYLRNKLVEYFNELSVNDEE